MNTNGYSHSRSFIALATAAMLVTVTAITGATAGEPPRGETVKFQDLDLTTQAGAETLYSRIHTAAKRVCSRPQAWQLALFACIKQAESNAVAGVNVPSLTALYRAKTGDRTARLAANQ